MNDTNPTPAAAVLPLPLVMEEFIREGGDPDLSHWLDHPEDYGQFVATHPGLVTS